MLLMAEIQSVTHRAPIGTATKCNHMMSSSRAEIALMGREMNKINTFMHTTRIAHHWNDSTEAPVTQSLVESKERLIEMDENKTNFDVYAIAFALILVLVLYVWVGMVWLRFGLPYRTYRSYHQRLNGDALALHSLAVPPIASLVDLLPGISHNMWIAWWCMESKMTSNSILPHTLCSLQIHIGPDTVAFALCALRSCTSQQILG